MIKRVVRLRTKGQSISICCHTAGQTQLTPALQRRWRTLLLSWSEPSNTVCDTLTKLHLINQNWHHGTAWSSLRSTLENKSGLNPCHLIYSWPEPVCSYFHFHSFALSRVCLFAQLNTFQAATSTKFIKPYRFFYMYIEENKVIRVSEFKRKIFTNL